MDDRRDQELLGQLARALRPEETPIPEVGLAALRAALDAREAAGATTTWPARTTRALSSKWRRIAAAAALGGGVIVGGTGVAFAAGGHVPEPVRSFVYHLGLPVDSPAVSRTHHDVNRLRAALRWSSSATATTSTTGVSAPTTAPGGSDASVAAAASDAKALAKQLSHLSRSDERRLGAAPWQVLAQADHVERAHGIAVTPVPEPSWMSTPPPGRTPDSTYPRHPGQHGGQPVPTTDSSPASTSTAPSTATDPSSPPSTARTGGPTSRPYDSPTDSPTTRATTTSSRRYSSPASRHGRPRRRGGHTTTDGRTDVYAFGYGYP